MSDIIRLLPDSVANQIAAGEVIQRPASVIKELVENAVDAGATDIRIFIKDAGKTLIQVVDNGKGMSETDARMAFERHATSKITAAEDLLSLHTMGFRGEALPSIGAVSLVEVKTRTPDSQLGTHIVINSSRVETQEPCVCDVGLNISVKNIFCSVPARRKFLKSDNVELSNIMREFERLALVNNGIKMSIDTGGGRNLDLRAGSFKQRISDIWKNNLNLQLLPVEVDTSLVKISGYVSRPEFARRRNPLQYLIANGRNMRHPYFHKAVMQCYDSLIAPDTQPCYFLKFEVDPSSIDVNIHPTKNEIKFEYEQEIWPILHAAVKAALGKFGAVPSIDFNSDVLPIQPLAKGELPEAPSLHIPEGYNPFVAAGMESPDFASAGIGDFSQHDIPERDQPSYRVKETAGAGKAPRKWQTLYEEFMAGARGVDEKKADGGDESESHVETRADAPDLPEIGDVPSAPMCIQYANKYIITTSREGILIIDQHRAHVKVLYERSLVRASHGGNAAQGVMFPETLKLDPEHRAAFDEVRPDLSAMGFRLEYDHDDVWRITAVPAMLRNASPVDIILRILDSVTEDSVTYSGSRASAGRDMMERMALVMARSSAIESGRKLSGEEMEHLVGELFSLPDPAFTPSGNRVYMVISDRNLLSVLR